MNNINEYINYQNSLNVLNEGFFDFVKKWVNRIFHKMFKANSFEELYSRLDTIENIIKYGAPDKQNFDSGIKPPQRKQSEPSDDQITTEKNDGEEKDSGKNEAFNADKPKRSRMRINEDVKLYQMNDVTAPDKVNMNIPSFPQVAATMLNSLKAQMDEQKARLSEKKLTSTLSDIRNKNSRLDSHYLQQLEILVSDFFKKYSAGNLNLPTPSKGHILNYDELSTWKKFSEKLSSGNKGFDSIRGAMKRVITEYKTQFNSELEELLKREDNFINKNKDGNKSDSDIKFEAEWKQKVTSKMEQIATNCEDYIDHAINAYFVSSPIYKSALEYCELALEVLIANSKNTLKNLNDNSFTQLYQEYTENPNGFINEVNKYLNEIKNNYSDVYNQFTIERANIKNLISEFFSQFNKFANAKMFDMNSYKNQILFKLSDQKDMQLLAYVLMLICFDQDINANDFVDYHLVVKDE